MQIANGRIGIEFTITGEGDMTRMSMQGKTAVPEYASMAKMDSPDALSYFWKKDAQGNPLPGAAQYVPTMLLKMDMELMKMLEERCSFSPGGLFYDAGNTPVREILGLYHQARRGMYDTIAHPDELMDKLLTMMGDLHYRSNIPDFQRKLRVKGGMGAILTLQKRMQVDFKQENPFAILADDNILKGYITGPDSMNLSVSGIRIKEKFYPGYGWIEIIHDPAMDVQENQFNDAPFYLRHPRRSFSVMIEDITSSESGTAAGTKIKNKIQTSPYFDNGSNIVFVRPNERSKPVYTSFEPGTYIPQIIRSYLGWGDTMHAAAHREHSTTILKETWGSAFYKDVSRVCLVELV
jgi:hypothetical protein